MIRLSGEKEKIRLGGDINDCGKQDREGLGGDIDHDEGR